MSEKSERFYGPIGKAAWDEIEAEIERQCAAAGMTPLERYSAGFTLDVQTGEVKLIKTPPKRVEGS